MLLTAPTWSRTEAARGSAFIRVLVPYVFVLVCIRGLPAVAKDPGGLLVRREEQDQHKQRFRLIWLTRGATSVRESARLREPDRYCRSANNCRSTSGRQALSAIDWLRWRFGVSASSRTLQFSVERHHRTGRKYNRQIDRPTAGASRRGLSISTLGPRHASGVCKV